MALSDYPKQFVQNQIDYFAKQVQLIVSTITGNEKNESSSVPVPVPLLINSHSASSLDFYGISDFPFQNGDVKALVEYDITINSNELPTTWYSTPVLNFEDSYFSRATAEQKQMALNYFNSLQPYEYFNILPSTYSPPYYLGEARYSRNYKTFYVNTDSGLVWDAFSVTSKTFPEHRRIGVFYTSQAFTPYNVRTRDTVVSTGEFLFNIYKDVPVITTDGNPVIRDTIVNNRELTTNTYITNEGDTINYYTNDNTFYLPVSDYVDYNGNFHPSVDISFDDLFDMFNTVLPGDIQFPSWEQTVELPFAYIEPIHELNYTLEMPDTSEYLDVSVISRPLSICADTIEYLWSNISALGFAPVLGFCLIATLIIKGLRGD